MEDYRIVLFDVKRIFAINSRQHSLHIIRVIYKRETNLKE